MEFYSKEGRDTYYGGASGQEFGEQRSNIQSLTLKSSEQTPHTMLVENATQTERRKHVDRC